MVGIRRWSIWGLIRFRWWDEVRASMTALVSWLTHSFCETTIKPFAHTSPCSFILLPNPGAFRVALPAAWPSLLGTTRNKISFSRQSSPDMWPRHTLIRPKAQVYLRTTGKLLYGWREGWWAPGNRGLILVVFTSSRPSVLLGITVSLSITEMGSNIPLLIQPVNKAKQKQI